MDPALVFGAFPLGLAGTPDGLASGPPDDFGQIAFDVLCRLIAELGGPPAAPVPD